jgi:hypothetical protein
VHPLYTKAHRERERERERERGRERERQRERDAMAAPFLLYPVYFQQQLMPNLARKQLRKEPC